MMRLDKYLSERLGIPRGESRKLAAKGRVTVNGVLTKKADTQIEEATAEVAVDGRPLAGAYQKYVYLMLNKPEGVVSAAQDKRDTTVVDLVKDAFPRRQLFPAGRLDKDTEGLLLLTNDGALTHRLLHPSHEVSKEYRVTVSGPVEHAAERLSRVRDVVGLPIRPAEVRELSRKGNRAELSVIIHEGRNRQIRRMCAQCALEVLRLQRVREHCLELGALPLGQWRYLTAEEITGLKEE